MTQFSVFKPPAPFKRGAFKRGVERHDAGAMRISDFGLPSDSGPAQMVLARRYL
jgi:hypothetical protein